MKLGEYARQLLNDKSLTDCEKLARIVEKAVEFSDDYGRDQSQDSKASMVVGQLMQVLTDLEGLIPSARGPNANNKPCRAGIFTEEGPTFKDTGFKSNFQDGSNLVRHFAGWFFAGHAAPWPSLARNSLYDQEHTNDPNDPDVALGLLAIDLGASFPSGGVRLLAKDIRESVCK